MARENNEISGKFAMEFARFLFTLAAGSQILLPGTDIALSLLDPEKTIDNPVPVYLLICWMALNLITIILTAFAISIETVVETGFGIGNPSIAQKNRYHKKAYFMVFLGWISYVLGFGFHNCGFAFYGEHNGIIYSVFIVFEVFIVWMSICTLNDFWNTSERYIHDD